MSAHKRNCQVLFMHRLMPVVLLLFTFASILLLNVRHISSVHAATNNVINFQARLQSATGSIVPDGNYNIEFKIYSASSGGTALWTEDYFNNASHGLTTVNGYFSANLGSLTAFPGINWDQPLWLTMNVGGTTVGTPSLDGEMSPRLTLTAVPYAFRAGQLATSNAASSFNSTLSIQAPTGGSQNFVIQDQGAAGTFNLLTANAAATGFIQNTTTLQVGSNFNIDGTGKAATFNASTALQTAGVNRIDSSGNLSNIGNISGTGNLQLSGTTGTSYVMSALGLGTTNPQSGSALTIANSSWISSVDSAGTGYINIFQVNSSNQIQVGAALNIDGGVILPVNGGQVTFADLPIDTTAISGTKESYTFRVGSANVLTIYGEADGSGNLQNGRVAIGSSIAPAYPLDVTGDINTSTGYRVGTVSGTSATCTGGLFLQNQVVAGGITTGGSCANGGVTTVGTIDGGTYSANGGSISGSTLSLQSASSTSVGLVTVGTQTFAGAKTFNNNIALAPGAVLKSNSYNEIIGIGSSGLYVQGGDGINLTDTTTIQSVSGTGSALNITGTASATATSSVINIGNLISGGNASANGGTYIGINTPSSGAGSVADFLNFQSNSVSKFKVSNAGTVSASSFLQNGNSVCDSSTNCTNYLSASNGVQLQASTPGTPQTGNINISGTAIVGGLTLSGNSTFINNSSTLDAALSITDKPTGGAIGTASTTVDISTTFTVNQTTAGQTLTLPNPTVTTAGRVIYVLNTGGTTFNIGTVVFAIGSTAEYIWNGTTWTFGSIDTGVTAVGAIDTQTASANGAVISGNTVYLQSASATKPGLINIGAQSIAGAKTFTGNASFTSGVVNIQASGSDSANALRVQQNGGTTVFNVDANSNVITVGGTLNSTGAATIKGGALNLNASSNFITNIGTGTTTGAVSIGNSLNTLAVNSNLTTITGNAIIKSVTNSASAIQLQNSAGSSFLTADSANQIINTKDINVGSSANIYTSGRLFSDGFETGNIALWTGGATSAGADYTATDPSVVRNGKYAQHFSLSNSATGGAVLNTAFAGTNTINAREYVYIASATTNVDMIRLASNTGFTLYRDSATGKLAVYNGASSTSTLGSTVMSLTAWHEVELDLTISASIGTISIYLDGTNVLSLTSQNTGTVAIAGLTIGDGNSSRTSSFYIDDVAADILRPGDSSSVNVADSFHVSGTSSYGGGALFQNAYNVRNAFQIQNAAGTSLFNVDTTNGNITLGTSTNGIVFNSTGGFVASGTAQHTKSIVLTPEYSGAVLDSANDSGGTVNCSTANAGTMTSGFTATGRQNYYNWNVVGATAQCYDVVVQVPLPSDWSSWSGAGNIYVYNSVGTDSTSVMVDAYDTNGTHDAGFTASTYSGISSGTTFSTTSLPTFSGTYAANGYLTLKVRVTSASAKNVRIGNITLTYNSKY
jgi:hypothetical protein